MIDDRKISWNFLIKHYLWLCVIQWCEVDKKKKFKDVAQEQGKRYQKENFKMTFKRFLCVYDESKMALNKKIFSSIQYRTSVIVTHLILTLSISY